VRPLLILHPTIRGKRKSDLNKLNKAEEDGCLRFCNLNWRTITEGFRDYSALWQHIYERPMTGSTILYTFARGPLDLEALGFSLPSL